ncbi:Uncharacterized protein DAT39_014561 [Clarias magur]|uniref:Uncharacterized protein n=1 Tax=Clarias magur TaxID=1594786 RepID=A0A8J4WXM1_CLAMG|nr:Uncharacterized protein DAT39_014561 [Clarias magur]
MEVRRLTVLITSITTPHLTPQLCAGRILKIRAHEKSAAKLHFQSLVSLKPRGFQKLHRKRF